MWLVNTILAGVFFFTTGLSLADNFENETKPTDTDNIIYEIEQKVGDDKLEELVYAHYNFASPYISHDLLGLDIARKDTKALFLALEDIHSLVSNFKIDLTIEDFVNYLRDHKLISFSFKRKILKQASSEEAFNNRVRGYIEQYMSNRISYSIRLNLDNLSMYNKKQNVFDTEFSSDKEFIQFIIKSPNMNPVLKSQLLSFISSERLFKLDNRIRGIDLFSNPDFIVHFLISQDISHQIKDRVIQRMIKAGFETSSIINEARQSPYKSIVFSDLFTSSRGDLLLSYLLRQKTQTQNLVDIFLEPINWTNITEDSYAFELVVSLFDSSSKTFSGTASEFKLVNSKIYTSSLYSSILKELSETISLELLYTLGLIPYPNKTDIQSELSGFLSSRFYRSLNQAIKERINMLFHQDVVTKIQEAFSFSQNTSSWTAIDEVLKNRDLASLLYNSKYISEETKQLIKGRVKLLVKNCPEIFIKKTK